MIEPLTFTFTAKISNDYFQIITCPQTYYLEQTPVTCVICYFSDSTVWWHLCFTGICFDWHTISKGNNILFITVLSQLPGYYFNPIMILNLPFWSHVLSCPGDYYVILDLLIITKKVSTNPRTLCLKLPVSTYKFSWLIPYISLKNSRE